MNNNLSNIHNIQELTRVFDAVVSQVNNPGLHDGTNASTFLNFLMQIPGLEKYVGFDYYNLIQNELKLTQNKTNHREHVKKLFMYPKYDYDPWIIVNIDRHVLGSVVEKLQNISFSFKMINGKVYLTTDSQNISEQIIESIQQYLDPSVKPNPEASHVTVVNSNVVSDIGQDKVENMLKQYDKRFNLSFGKIKSTVSRDWSLFSLCYVIEAGSLYLNQFVSKFNDTFGTKIRISPHITFATKLRSF